MKPVRVPKTAEIVADSIRARIIGGDLAEGDSLPPEAQLVEQFGVSRPTLREAFRILEAERLIAVTRGSRSGARVSRPMAESVARYAGYALKAEGVTTSDLFEARLAIEPPMVRRVAESRDPEAVARLRREVLRLAALHDGGRDSEVLAAGAEFHRLLMELGGNATLHFLTRVLQDLIAQVQARFLAHWPDDRERRAVVQMGLRSLDRLVDLIEAGDGDAAERHWRLHLTNINQAWASGRTLLDVLGG